MKTSLSSSDEVSLLLAVAWRDQTTWAARDGRIVRAVCARDRRTEGGRAETQAHPGGVGTGGGAGAMAGRYGRAMSAGRFALVCVFAWCVAGMAWAHDPGLSTAQGQLRAAGLEIAVGFAPADAEQLLPPDMRVSGKWTPAEFVAAQPLLAELAPQIFELSAGGVELAPRETRVELAAGDALNFFLVYPRPPPGVVTLRAARLGALPAGHRQFVIVVDEQGSTVAKKLLSAKDDGIEVAVAAPGVDHVDAGLPARQHDRHAMDDDVQEAANQQAQHQAGADEQRRRGRRDRGGGTPDTSPRGRARSGIPAGAPCRRRADRALCEGRRARACRRQSARPP